MLLTTGRLAADARDVTLQWDAYTDPTATALKLMSNSTPTTTGMNLLEAHIPPDSTRLTVTMEVNPGDTLYFAMQAANRNVEPALFSELTEWVLWYWSEVEVPPMTPTGLKISIQVDIISPPQ